MAEFNIPIEVPADRVDGVVAALRWRQGNTYEDDPDANGNPIEREKTIPELREGLKADVIAQLKELYKKHQKYLASEAADDLIVLPDIT